MRQANEAKLGTRPFDWRSSLRPETKSWLLEKRGQNEEADAILKKVDDQLDTIAEMAAQEGVNFKSLSDESRVGTAVMSEEGIYSPGQADLELRKTSPIAQMINWGAKKQILTPKEAIELRANLLDL